MISEQAFNSRNMELRNSFFILLIVCGLVFDFFFFFLTTWLFNFYFGKMFLLTLSCPSAFQKPSWSANNATVIQNIILDNFVPDNSTYHVIFSKGVK